MKKLILIVIVMLFASNAFGQKTPKFSDYPAKVQTATAKQVNLKSHPRARLFRTNLREALKEGVNFAGRFIIATWGCGTSCGDSGIIDAKTGNVFFPTELGGVSMGMGELSEGEPLEYRKNSRLLIINGYLGGNESSSAKYGIWYYEWTGKTLKLIKFVKKSDSSN